MYKFELGAEVKSDITGFKGINVSNSTHINSCNRCYVQPKINKDGKQPDGLWCDELELVLIKNPKVKAKKIDTGGFPSKVK